MNILQWFVFSLAPIDSLVMLVYFLLRWKRLNIGSRFGLCLLVTAPCTLVYGFTEGILLAVSPIGIMIYSGLLLFFGGMLFRRYHRAVRLKRLTADRPA